MAKDGHSQMVRWFEVLRLLQNETLTGKQELAAAVGLSIRQIERIMAKLTALGFPVENEWGRGYRIANHAPRLPINLSSEETWALLLLQQCAPKALGPAAQGALDRLIARMRAQISRDTQSKIQQLAQQVASDPAPDQVVAEIWQTITDAITRGLQVRLEYKKLHESEAHTRILDPWAILTVQGRWYVQGHDHQSQEPRTFRMVRIRQAQLLSVKGERPADYDASKNLFHRLSLGEGEAHTVTLHGNEFLASWLRENPLHPEQAMDGTRITLPVRNISLLLDVLSGLNGLRGVEPAWLHKQLLEHLEQKRKDLLVFEP